MKQFGCVATAIAAALLFSAVSFGQTDEIRQATGLPIQIGQPVIYGQVIIKKLGPNERKPIVNVVLLEGGSQVARVQANDAGYYYFLQNPRSTATLVFELNNNEVGRIVLSTASTRVFRQDLTIDWQEAQRILKPAVVSMKDSYPRNDENSKAFELAMKHVKDKDNAKAAQVLQGIIERDPKDYVAWTELGTVLFKTNALDNAEACYFKAIELKKDYFMALFNLGKLYLSRKQADNAVLVLTNAVAAMPTSAEAHQYMGEAYLLAKKGSSAVHHFNEALKLAPAEMAEVHLRLAMLYDAGGMKSKAAAEYKAFLEKRPDHPERAQLEKYIAENPAK